MSRLDRKPILNLTVLSHANVGGLASDDDMGESTQPHFTVEISLTGPGIVSILMLWGYLEIGVAIIAACLPMLRPLFQSWSIESVIRSVRSAISLGSFGSNNRFSPIDKGGPERSESETAIAGIQGSGEPQHGLVSIDVEAYAMGKVSGGEDKVRSAGGDGIWRETELRQSSRIVV